MNDEIDHIDELQKRLYARDPESVPKRKFGILRPIRQNVSSNWGKTEISQDKIVRRTSVTGYKRFFLISLIFFALALGAALFSIYRGAMTLSSKNVEVTILGNSFVAGGEELPIQVEIINKNSADLIDAELTLNYPKGALDVSGAEVVNIKKVLGTIPSGKTKSEAFVVTLYGEQGSSKNITATLTYKLAGANALFQKEKGFAVMINSAPLALVVDGPATVGINQPFTISIRNAFTGDKPLSDTLVRAEYPNGFTFISASPAPIAGNNIWDLGTLEKGSESTIVIKGRLAGEIDDQKSFRIYVGSRESGSTKIAVSYNSALHNTVIAEPFLAGIITVEAEEGSIVALPHGSDVAGSINWVNNSPVAITNPIFVLSVSGDAIVPGTISADDGFYDGLARTLTWDGNTLPALTRIEAGQRGVLPFRFKTKTPGSDISLSLSVEGTFPDRGFAKAKVENIDEKIIRFTSRLQFAAQALYSIGSIKNTGPFPPQADQETTYSIVWTMKPTDSALTSATATATLMPGVVWNGVIVPQSETVNYNPDTRVISWTIGAVPKATATPQSKSVTFQVKVRPTKSQIGNQLDLISETTINAIDAVAKVPITITRQPLTTRLDTDPAYTAGKERVVP
jgi:hypothetical protein